MGSAARLKTIGPYSSEIADCLMYPEDHYDDVPEGTMVQGFVCGVETSGSSKLLAEAFGFELWDFTKHIFKIVEGKAPHWVLLDEALQFSEYDFDEVMEKISRLVKHDHLFVFEPNG